MEARSAFRRQIGAAGGARQRQAAQTSSAQRQRLENIRSRGRGQLDSRLICGPVPAWPSTLHTRSAFATRHQSAACCTP